MHLQSHTYTNVNEYAKSMTNVLKIVVCSMLLNIVTNIIPLYRTKDVKSQEIIKHLPQKIQLHLDLVNPVLPLSHHSNHLRGQQEDTVTLTLQMTINHLVNSFNEPDIPLISLLFS